MDLEALKQLNNQYYNDGLDDGIRLAEEMFETLTAFVETSYSDDHSRKVKSHWIAKN